MACAKCQSPFTVTAQDRRLLARFAPDLGGETFQIPEPQLCPDCRHQRRLSWRNERNYYHRVCDLSGKKLVSAYAPDCRRPIFDYDLWWTDRYDPFVYGRDFDFSRPFFEQFFALMNAVPQMALLGANNENCPFCHLLANCKDCYLLIESSNCELCFYCYWMQKCKSCVDCSFCHECELCYEIDNCYQCYNLRWSRNCMNSHDSFFLEDCTSCKNCFGCSNLVQREYCVFNQQFSKADYLKFIADAGLNNFSHIEHWKKKQEEFSREQPKKYAQIRNSENCTGDYIVSSKNLQHCFHAHDAEECAYGEHVWRNSKFNMDVSTVGRDAELVYEAINTGISVYQIQFAIQCWTSSNLLYCDSCMNSEYCFGCVGLKRGKYCIFNRQYPEAEYFALAAKLARHMQSTGEWGEFFPSKGSSFSYNESCAMEQFPLEKEAAVKQGFRWRDPDPRDYLPATAVPAETISEVADDVTKALFSCGETKKNFRITSQELQFYRQAGIPLPRLCPDARHRARMQRRTPNKLWQRTCHNCKTAVLSAIAPSNPEQILCSGCYGKEYYS